MDSNNLHEEPTYLLDRYHRIDEENNNQSMRIRPQATPTCVKPSTLHLLRRTRRHYYNNFPFARNSEKPYYNCPFLPEPKNIQNPFISQAIRNALSYRAELVAALPTQLDQPLLYLFHCGTRCSNSIPFPLFRCGTRPNTVYLIRFTTALVPLL